MTREEFLRIMPNASESTIRRTLQHYAQYEHRRAVAAISNPESEPQARPLEPRGKTQKNRRRGPAYLVTFISVRVRELDDDNLIGGCKPLRDAVAEHLGLADDKKSIKFAYGQVVSPGEQGTIVMIEKLKNKKGQFYGKRNLN